MHTTYKYLAHDMQPERRNGAFQASFLQLHEQEQKPLHMHIMKDNKSQFEIREKKSINK